MANGAIGARGAPALPAVRPVRAPARILLPHAEGPRVLVRLRRPKAAAWLTPVGAIGPCVVQYAGRPAGVIVRLLNAEGACALEHLFPGRANRGPVIYPPVPAGTDGVTG